MLSGFSVVFLNMLLGLNARLKILSTHFFQYFSEHQTQYIDRFGRLIVKYRRTADVVSIFNRFHL